jgi:hypothetical protein
MEVVDMLKSAHLTNTQRSWLPSALNIARDLVVNVARGLVLDVAGDAAIGEAADGLLETPAELIAMSSHQEL